MLPSFVHHRQRFGNNCESGCHCAGILASRASQCNVKMWKSKMKLSIFYSSAQKREHYIRLDRHNRIDKKYISFSIVQMYTYIDKLQLRSQFKRVSFFSRIDKCEEKKIKLFVHMTMDFFYTHHTHTNSHSGMCHVFPHNNDWENTLYDLFTGCYLTFFTKATSSFVCPNSCWNENGVAAELQRECCIYTQ